MLLGLLMNDKEEVGRFVVCDQAHTQIGEITWRDEAGLMVIDHTYVDPSYREQGIAAQLVRLATQRARREGLRVRPDCPYARNQFEQHEAYQDLLETVNKSKHTE